MFEDKELLEKMEQRRGAMTKERASFISHWREITQFISPRTARYDKTDRNRGDKQGQDILNETATLALRTLKSGLMAGMSSPARPWFVLGLSDPDLSDYGPVKEWLDTATRMMRDVFARSNIYSILPKIYSSIGAYGTGAFGVVEDEKEVIRAYMFPVGTFMCDCNSRMVVDSLYREHSYTVRQLVSTYGLENCSTHVQTQYERGNYGMWVDVVHAIEPNLDRKKGSIESRDKEYISVSYEAGKDRDKALSIKGFDEFPAIVTRWEVNGEDVYGTSCPGMDALGGVKGLQFKERRKYQSMDKIVNSPVNVDATLRNTGADLLPGGINWVPGLSQSANAGIRPIYDIHPSIVDMIRTDIAESTQLIRRAFYEDLMLMLAQSDNPQMTAREVDERSQEKLLVLGPLLEQQNDDLFDPLIDRVFNIMLRRNMFPTPPLELQGEALRVEYVSSLAQAQKLIGVASMERFVGFVGNLAQFDPTVLDKIDGDELVDEYAGMTGVPAKVVNTDEEVEGIRSARQQQQNMQQMAEMAPALQSGAQAAKTLSETNISEVNGLTRLMGGM